MRFRALSIAMAGLFVLAVAGGAAAEEKKVSFGAQASWASDEIGLGVGARARYDLGELREGIGAVASFDLFFPGDDVKYWEINANLTYDLPLEGSAVPYVGAGPVLAHVGAGSVSSNEVGFNILGGVKMDMGESMKLFAEAKLEVEGGELFVVSVGVRF